MISSPTCSTAAAPVQLELDEKPLAPGNTHARKYRGLQVLRFVAAALVVVYHATSLASEQIGGVSIWKKGGYGIDLFFVLSGFVIVWSSAPLFKSRSGWLTFVRRRAVRVIPMYWIATTMKAIAIVCASSMVVHARLSISTLLASYAFIPCRNLDNNFMPILGVGWTLNYEMFFYALVAIALFMRVHVFRFVGTILALLAIGSWFRQPSWPWPSFYLNSLVLEFFLGMLIARYCLQGKRLAPKVAVPMLLAGFILLLTPTPMDVLAPVIPEGVPAAMIILATASLEDYLPRIPKPVIFLSEASYSIYLFHLLSAQLPGAAMAKLHLHYPWLVVVLSIGCSLAAGSIMHQFVERPMTNLFRARVRGRRHEMVPAA